ncbi:MAG: extradiol dioxygenase [Gemmatimonadaceae bacterium]
MPGVMINGVHALLYSSDPDATRDFIRDAMQLASVDAGRGWLIFALPPAEIAVHPSDGEKTSDIYLMCDDLQRTLDALESYDVTVTQPITEQRWGKVTAIRVPGGVELGLYQPYHPTALSIAAEESAKYRNTMGGSP